MPRHRAHRRNRTRRRLYAALAGGLAVVVIVVTVGYLLGRGPDPAASGTAAADSRAVPCPAVASASCRTAAVTPGSTAEPSGSKTGEPLRPSPARSALPSPARQDPSSPAATPAGPAPAGGTTRAGRAAAAVLAVINAARVQAGLPAYTVLAGLQTSARQHNLLMAGGCGLSHQCPGEPALGARETAAGVQWTTAGENIGEGGPVADTTAAITQLAVALTRDMLNEQAPDDGHRLNLLSSAFTSVGIAVYRGTDGTVWMTQDFAN